MHNSFSTVPFYPDKQLNVTQKQFARLCCKDRPYPPYAAEVTALRTTYDINSNHDAWPQGRITYKPS